MHPDFEEVSIDQLIGIQAKAQGTTGLMPDVQTPTEGFDEVSIDQLTGFTPPAMKTPEQKKETYWPILTGEMWEPERGKGYESTVAYGKQLLSDTETALKKFSGQGALPAGYQQLALNPNLSIEELPVGMKQAGAPIGVSALLGATGQPKVDLERWANELPPGKDVEGIYGFLMNVVHGAPRLPVKFGLWFLQELPKDIRSAILSNWKTEHETIEAQLQVGLGIPAGKKAYEDPASDALGRAIYKNIIGLANFSLAPVGAELGDIGGPELEQRFQQAQERKGPTLDIRRTPEFEWAGRIFMEKWHDYPVDALAGLLPLKSLFTNTIKPSIRQVGGAVRGAAREFGEYARAPVSIGEFPEEGPPSGRSPFFEWQDRQYEAVLDKRDREYLLRSLRPPEEVAPRKWGIFTMPGQEKPSPLGGTAPGLEAIEGKVPKEAGRKKAEPKIQPYEAPMEEVEVGRNIRYTKSPIENVYRSRNNTPWKTRPATLITKNAIEEIEGIKVVPVELPGGGWFLAEREYAKTQSWIKGKEESGKVPSEVKVEEPPPIPTATEQAASVIQELISKPEETIHEPAEEARIKRQASEASREEQELDTEIDLKSPLDPAREKFMEPKFLDDNENFQTEEEVKGREIQYADPYKLKDMERNPELKMQYILWKLNKAIHEENQAAADAARAELGEMASKYDNPIYKKEFLYDENFRMFKTVLDDAAEYARVSSYLPRGPRVEEPLPFDKTLDELRGSEADLVASLEHVEMGPPPVGESYDQAITRMQTNLTKVKEKIAAREAELRGAKVEAPEVAPEEVAVPEVLPYDLEGKKARAKELAEKLRKARAERGTRLNVGVPISYLPEEVRKFLKGRTTWAPFRNKEIFDETGFWLGRDGKWRYEIDTSQARYHPISATSTIRKTYDRVGTVTTNLESMLDYPELYKVVPQMRSVFVEYDKNLPTSGVWKREEFRNVIALRKLEDKRTLFHEVQHAVNDFTGSAFKGTNVEAEAAAGAGIKGFDPNRAYMLDPGEMEARLAEMRMNMSAAERRKTPPWETLDRMLVAEGYAKEEVIRLSDKEILDKYLSHLREGVKEGSYTKEEAKRYESYARQDVGFAYGVVRSYEHRISPEPGTKLYAGLPIDAEKVKDMFDDFKAAAAPPSKDKAKAFVDKFQKDWVDFSGKLEDEYFKFAQEHGVEQAYRTMIDFNLVRGATPKATAWLKQQYKTIFGGLSEKYEDVLSRIIFSKRVMQLDAPDYPITTEMRRSIVHPRHLDSKYHKQYLDNLAQVEGIPEAMVPELMARAEGYFGAMREILKKALDAELIDETDYNNMIKFNYARRQLIEKLDPTVQAWNPFKGKILSTPDSGIDYLKRGKAEDILDYDAKLLLAETAYRIEKRVAMQQANMSAWELAGELKDNPLVQRWETVKERKGIDADTGQEVVYQDIKKKTPPPGWKPVEVFIQGKRRQMIMPEDLATMWSIRQPEVSWELANQLRYYSGSFILRPMATGITLKFALLNPFRDLPQIWGSSDMMIDGKWVSTYSPHLPVVVPQMAGDILTVALDTILRRGRALDYINEGGGMDWLISQQGSPWKRSHGYRIASKAWDVFDKIYGVLSYLGETGELLSRLMLRERALKRIAQRENLTMEEVLREPKFRQEATWVARNYMDFSKGGSKAKAADNALPYFSAGIQATRGPIRAAMRNPTEAIYKSMWVMSTAMGLYLANRYMNPKATQAVSDSSKSRFWWFTQTDTPVYDERGEPAYPYFTIPKTQWQMFFATAGETMAKIALGEKIDPKTIATTLKELAVPFDLGSLPPTFQAIAGYLTDTAFWEMARIWHGPEGVSSGKEYMPDTPMVWRYLGEKTGISPVRGQYGLERFFTSGNLYTYATGFVMKQIFGKLPEEMQNVPLAIAASRVPEIGGFLRLARPGQVGIKEEKKITEKYADKAWAENMDIEAQANGYLAGVVTRDQVRERIKQYKDPYTRERLTDILLDSIKMRHVDPSVRSLMLRLKRMTPEARAEVFYEKWKTAGPEERQAIRKGMGLMEGTFTDKGEGGERFWMKMSELKRLEQQKK